MSSRTGLWLRREVADRIVFHGRPILCALAFVWRRLLFRTTFVAVTGSFGKTTAKECMAACLAATYRTACARGDTNADGWLAWSMLRVRPWHRYAVFEVAAGAPGRMATRIPFIRPDIAVVLNIGRTHTAQYPTLEACAEEKGRLVEGLRAGGLAVLNGDDPRVTSMRPPPGARVLRFGTDARADVRGEALEARWPERFSLRAEAGGEHAIVQTQLVGAHWMPVVLAALAVARHAGVPLDAAAAAVGRVPPVTGRLEPVELPGGATVLRDDHGGAIDTLDAALRVLETARAPRRVFLVTDFSDTGETRKHRLRHLGLAAARAADMAVFVGHGAAYCGRRAVEAGLPPDRAHNFPTLEESARFLRSELRPGDLLLLKGRTADHASRVFHALLGPIRCWKTECRRRVSCDRCWELGAKLARSR